MKQYWLQISSKIDAMSIRERGMIFAAAAFVLVAMIDMVLLEPLLVKEKVSSDKLHQQQKEMADLQAVIQTAQQSQFANANSPLRGRIAELQAQLKEKEAFLQSRRDRLVEPEQIAGLMEQVLRGDDRLQLVEMKTLPLSLLIEQPEENNKDVTHVVRPIYKHGVQITVKGTYLDLLHYLATLEKLPAQMFWGEVSMSVEKHPDAVLTLTVYTLSLDKTWLTV